MLACKVCAPFESSYHCSVNCLLYFSNKVFAKNALYTAYDYTNSHWDAINNNLNCTDWSNLYTDCINSNDFWNCFSNHVIHLCDLYYTPARHLRSTNTQRLCVPRTKLKTGNVPTGIAAPRVWNALSSEVTSAESLTTFRK